MSNSNTEALASGASYVNPVHPAYFADPFVWKHDGVYYAVGTGPQEAAGHAAESGEGIFPMLESRDLVHWFPIGRAMRKPEFGAAHGDSFWAPEVAYHEGRFFLYYSVGLGDQGHHLRVAVSTSPGGPYHDTGSALTSSSEWLFAIDPHPFRDTDGRWYLFFAADFLDSEPPGRGSIRAGTALVAQPLESMTKLTEGSHVVLRARHDWQRFESDRPIYGGRYDWHTLEGPCVRKHLGRYYCFYSGGRWETEGYGVDYVVADHVLGPYAETGGETGPRILKTQPGRMLGPGHNSLVEGPDGKTTFIVYHAWDAGKTARRLCIDPLYWGLDGPSSPGPTWTRQSFRNGPLSPQV
ncbi:MAG: glycoside hydrolase family 43 [Fibrobacteres bacterium]|nr:glycoside hydrolase family 43 [Fibrobacterota bacterium]